MTKLKSNNVLRHTIKVIISFLVSIDSICINAIICKKVFVITSVAQNVLLCNSNSPGYRHFSSHLYI